jgi:crossover junction endodeoxyribonuclease RuvC
MRVLAIDPGYERVGIAIIEKSGSQKEQLIFSECFKTSAKSSFPARLELIGNEIETLIKEYTPQAMALEKLFFNTNQTTAMKVSEVRGMLLYLARSYQLTICEYTPLQIKIAATGYGQSSKQQVIAMVSKLIKIEKEIKYDDEYDAIACGLTCLASEIL